MSVELIFEDAVPEIDNPWLKAVEEIAGTTKDGKPAARKTTIPAPEVGDEEAEKAFEKLLRLAHQAGKEVNPPVTVRKTVSPVKTRTVGVGKSQREERYVEVTIWTVPPITKNRRTKEEIAAEKAAAAEAKTSQEDQSSEA